MGQELHRCIRSVGGTKTIRYAKTKSGKQRFKCKSCGKTFLENYSYLGSLPDTNDWILKLLKEGTGIRSIARLLSISPTTVLRRILKLSKAISKPFISKGKIYELDELCSYIGNKENRIWVAYALRRDTGTVVDFVIGRRTNKTLRFCYQYIAFIGG